MEDINLISSDIHDNTDLNVAINLGSGKVLDEPTSETVEKQEKSSEDSAKTDIIDTNITLPPYKPVVPYCNYTVYM